MQHLDRPLDIASGFVDRKMIFCQTLLRLDVGHETRDAVSEQRSMAGQALGATSPAQLRGIEGLGARAHIQDLRFVRGAQRHDASARALHAKNRRPSRAPLHAMPSLADAAPTRDWMVVPWILGACDVCDQDRLRRVHGCMSGDADALQQSVLQCALSRKEQALMSAALGLLIHGGPIASW